MIYILVSQKTKNWKDTKVDLTGGGVKVKLFNPRLLSDNVNLHKLKMAARRESFTRKSKGFWPKIAIHFYNFSLTSLFECATQTHINLGDWRSKDGAQDFLPERLQLVILWFWFKLQPTGKTQVFVNDGSSLKVDITRILLINIIKLIEGRPTKGWIMFLPCKPLMNLQSPTKTIRFIDLIIT